MSLITAVEIVRGKCMRNGCRLEQLGRAGLRQEDRSGGHGMEFWQRADVVGVLLRGDFGEEMTVGKEARCTERCALRITGIGITELRARGTTIRGRGLANFVEAAGERG